MRHAWVYSNSVGVQFKALCIYRMFYLLKCFVIYSLAEIKNFRDNGLSPRCSLNQYD